MRENTIIACAHCQAPKKRRRATTRFCSRRCARLAIGVRKGLRNAGSFGGGRPAWNKGLKGVRVGERRSDETKRRISEAQRGERAPNWRGGISTENDRFRRSAAYKAWRRLVFERDDFACQDCGARSEPGNRIRLNADHIKPFATHPELRLELSNGRTLCEGCHRKTPTYGAGARQIPHDGSATPERRRGPTRR